MSEITRRPAEWTLTAPIIARASRDVAATPAAVFDVLAVRRIRHADRTSG